MTIDCHAHWIPPRLAELLRARRAAPCIARVDGRERLVAFHGSRAFDSALGDSGFRLETMKRHSVGMQLLSLPGLFGIDCLPADESEPLVAAFNNEAAELCRREPDTFIGLAALPLRDMERACRELERGHMLGLRGAILPAPGFVTLSTARQFEALFSTGHRLHSHFFIHPGPVRPSPETDVRAHGEDNAWQRRIVLETQAVLSAVMVTMNLTSFLEPYLHVSVQVANLGGTMPFLVERMDEVHRSEGGEGAAPSQRMHRCYVDTASFGPRSVEVAVATYGADRLLFGTDCPIFDMVRMLEALKSANISAAAHELILSSNAKALFSI